MINKIIINMSSEKQISKKSTSFKDFYFKFEHKLSMVPHIQEQIREFIRKFQGKVQSMDKGQCRLLAQAIQIKIQKIEQFYDTNYTDYRAHMILRSKNLLHQFLIKNVEKLCAKDEPKQAQPSTSRDKGIQSKIKQTRAGISSRVHPKQFERNIIQSKEKSRVNKRIKTQVSSKDYHSSKRQLISEEKKTTNTPILIKYSEQQQYKRKQPANIRSPKIRKVVAADKNHFHAEPDKKVSKQQYIRYLKSKKK